MRLVMTLLVRDEEDILDANLRYHFAAGVDFVIATDNRSVDSSSDILRTYEREGRLRLIEERGDNHAQDRWVTRMARLAATEHGADWVVNNDADEFWWPETGTLKSVLESLPRKRRAVRGARTNFVARPPSGQPFYRTMTVRERHSLEPGTEEPLQPKVCHQACRNIEVGMGNHWVAGRWRVRRHSLRGAPVPITIFHFPIRSFAQFKNKVEKGGAAASRNPPMWESWASMRMRYGLLQRGQLEQYYESLVRDDAAIARGIAAGDLIVDERLRRTLDGLYGVA